MILSEVLAAQSLSVVPDDVLLKAFFELRKNDDKMLRRTQLGDTPKTFEEVRDIVEVAFNSMATERDAVAAAISKGILNTEMLLAYETQSTRRWPSRSGSTGAPTRSATSAEGDPVAASKMRFSPSSPPGTNWRRPSRS